MAANNTLIFPPDMPTIENGDTLTIKSEWKVSDGKWEFVKVTDWQMAYIRVRGADEPR